MSKYEAHYRQAVENAIRRDQPHVRAVEFDPDGEHVNLLMDATAFRYRLGPDVQRYLSGEFPGGTYVGKPVELLPPRTD